LQEDRGVASLLDKIIGSTRPQNEKEATAHASPVAQILAGKLISSREQA
jgi:hypothetical protein